MLRALPLQNDSPDLFCSLFELVRKHPPEAIPAEGLAGQAYATPRPSERGCVVESQPAPAQQDRASLDLPESAKGEAEGGGVYLSLGHVRSF